MSNEFVDIKVNLTAEDYCVMQKENLKYNKVFESSTVSIILGASFFIINIGVMV